MPAESRRFEVSSDAEGSRLDTFLAARLSLSRAQVKRLLDSGAVSVDSHRMKERDKGLLLGAGAIVDVEAFTAPGAVAVTPQPEVELRVLAEGDGYLVVDKPAGVPVHPLEEGETGTLLNAVAARHPEIQGVGEAGLRSGVVHRLDVDTSGVLIFATTQSKWEQLRDAFREHETRKVYRAIVQGKLTGSKKESMNLVIAQHKPARVRVVEEASRGVSPRSSPTSGGGGSGGVRRCHLAWRALENFRGATLVEINLGTGFLHQIRVMFAHLGHPVLGDPVYGEPDESIARPMLHASQLEVCGINAHSEDPTDFLSCLSALRTQARP